MTPSLTLSQPPWRRTVDGSGGPCCSDPGLVRRQAIPSQTRVHDRLRCLVEPAWPHTARTQLRQPLSASWKPSCQCDVGIVCTNPVLPGGSCS